MTEHKLKWILIASLVLNVFLIGGVAGGVYRMFWSDSAPLSAKAGQRGLRFAAEDLSIERQKEFHKTLREARREARPLIAASKQARTEVRQLVAAPSFDRPAVLAAIAQTREADIALRMRIEETLVNFAATLSQQEREKLAEGLARRGPLREQANLVKWCSDVIGKYVDLRL
ncbi:MAG: periplasmic heavy metal sensor [Methylophilaceae bacterium]